MALDPLQCPACAAPVPLVAGERGSCPSCGAPYPIPDTYQALRDESIANARKPEALALAKALGKPPPALIQAFAMFSSTWFVMLGLGVWIAGGIILGGVATPLVGHYIFHVNTYDVLSEARKMQLMMMVPFGTLVIGFTLSSWARKSGIVRGGLQSALAAKPPARSGGPKTCHRCGAPLSPEAGSLTAVCMYCHADNLVEMPRAWVEGMRAQSNKLVKEVATAEVVWRNEKRSLRRGLILRLTLWTVLMLLPIWFIFGAVSGPPTYASLSYAHPEGPPTELPPWGEEVKSRVVDSNCKRERADEYRSQPICDRERCALYVLVPLRHGEVLRHYGPDLPAGSVLDVQMHDQSFLDDGWSTIASAPLSPDHDAVTPIRYSSWYRLRVTVPGEDHAYYQYCATVKSTLPTR